MRRKALAAIGAAALLAAGGISAYAASGHSSTRHLKLTLDGAQISTGDYAFKVVSSLDGTGAAITHVTCCTFTGYPDKGRSVTTIYFRDGVSKQRDSFTQFAPNSEGISRFTGSGHCAGGTRIHKTEKCSYTFTGTYNVKNNQNDLVGRGTDTR